MKSVFLILLSFLSSGAISAWAANGHTAQFERVASCGSYYYQNSGEIQLDKGSNRVSFKDLTKACSLYQATLEGKEVCESAGFGWLRPNGGVALKFSKSYIHETSCKRIDDTYSCETSLTVECE